MARVEPNNMVHQDEECIWVGHFTAWGMMNSQSGLDMSEGRKLNP